MAKRQHVWREHHPRAGQKKDPDYCERCGCDRDSPDAKLGCRPTRI
jgi:hypothetical protein